MNNLSVEVAYFNFQFLSSNLNLETRKKLTKAEKEKAEMVKKVEIAEKEKEMEKKEKEMEKKEKEKAQKKILEIESLITSIIQQLGEEGKKLIEKDPKLKRFFQMEEPIPEKFTKKI